MIILVEHQQIVITALKKIKKLCILFTQSDMLNDQCQCHPQKM